MKPAFRALSAVLAALALDRGRQPAARGAVAEGAIGKAPAGGGASCRRAVEILSRYTRAVGGERVIRQYRSRRAIGRFELRAQGISGPDRDPRRRARSDADPDHARGAWRAAAGLRRLNRLVGGSRGRPPGAVRPRAGGSAIRRRLLLGYLHARRLRVDDGRRPGPVRRARLLHREAGAALRLRVDSSTSTRRVACVSARA